MRIRLAEAGRQFWYVEHAPPNAGPYPDACRFVPIRMNCPAYDGFQVRTRNRDLEQPPPGRAAWQGIGDSAVI